MAPPAAALSQSRDWIVTDVVTPTSLTASASGNYVTLSNGLLARTFAVSPCWGTVELELLPPPGSTFFRAMSPEATLTLNGTALAVGGCVGQAIGEWFDPATAALAQDPTACSFARFTTSAPVAPYAWTPGTRRASPNVSWPPRGLHVAVEFDPPAIFPVASAASLVRLNGTEFPCGAAGCLTGWPTCDNSSVPGQCSFPAADAAALCAAWPACVGVNCNHGRADCQARAAPFALTPSGSFDVYIRSAPPPDLSLVLHYEMYDGLPALRKWLSVSVAAGGDPLVLSDLMVELLRSPNEAPERMTVITVEANNPTPWSQQTVPELTQAFPGREQQYWYFDPVTDACCDTETHVPYTYYTSLRAGYGFDTVFGGTTGPGALLLPGAPPYVSQAVHTVYHDTTALERQGIGLRKVAARLAPQLTEAPMHYMITDISSTAAFRLAIDQAAAAGYDFVIVGYGAAGYCGMCPGQLQNATWVVWFKAQVDYGRSRGVGVSAYTLMQHNGWGEDVPAAEQVLSPSGQRGGIACFATDWHAAYRQSVLEFAAEVGLVGVETDGQYESAPCADTGGDHHHNGLTGSWDAQLAATAAFNAGMKAQGLYQTGADAYYWSGANRWNHADTDAGYSLGALADRLTIGRLYVYDSTFTRLHTSGMYGLNDIVDECRGTAAGRLACVDFALASFFGQGTLPVVVAASLWPAGDPDAAALSSLFANWTTYYAAHVAVLSSYASLHLRRPTSRALEAVVHLSADPSATDERAYVAVVNPTGGGVTDAGFSVDLYYAGLAPGHAVDVWSVAPGAAPALVRAGAIVGRDAGVGVYEISLPLALSPVSYAFYVVKQST